MAILHQLLDNARPQNNPQHRMAATTHLVDARQLYCPEPVMLLHNAVRDIPSGHTIELLATDPSTQRDVPKFCHFLGHELLQQAQVDNEFHYWIRKK